MALNFTNCTEISAMSRLYSKQSAQCKKVEINGRVKAIQGYENTGGFTIYTEAGAYDLGPTSVFARPKAIISGHIIGMRWYNSQTISFLQLRVINEKGRLHGPTFQTKSKDELDRERRIAVELQLKTKIHLDKELHENIPLRKSLLLYKQLYFLFLVLFLSSVICLWISICGTKHTCTCGCCGCKKTESDPDNFTDLMQTEQKNLSN